MVEIGEMIARARQEKELQLEEIAEQTRISLKYLQDIEQGKFDFLPRPYVIAYMKTFARCVGLDGENLVKVWREREAAIASAETEGVESAQAGATQSPTHPTDAPLSASAPESTSRRQTAYSPPEPQAPPPALPYVKEIAAGFALFGALALLLYFSTTSSKREAAQKEPVEEIPFEQVAQESEAEQADTLSPAIVESEPVKKPMRLEIRAQDVVWVQVVTDRRDSVDYTMRSGTVQAWQAMEQFYVRVGNAGALKFFLDGKDLGVAGGPGQVGGILVTHDGIKTRRLSGASRRAAEPERQDSTLNQ